MKLCKDCKWCSFCYGPENPKCTHPKTSWKVGKINLVTGVRNPPSRYLCEGFREDMSREPFKSVYCGTEAKYFESKEGNE